MFSWAGACHRVVRSEGQSSYRRGAMQVAGDRDVGQLKVAVVNSHCDQAVAGGYHADNVLESVLRACSSASWHRWPLGGRMIHKRSTFRDP